MRVDADDFARPCSCGREHQIAVKEILIEAGAVEKLEEEMSEGMLREYISPLVICDTNTYAATEELMEDIYDRCQVLVLDAEGLQADRHAIKIVENNMEEDIDLILAVGAGTIHDISRYIAHNYKVPFISVPTAASGDGFVTTVAAMTLDGVKKTVPSVAPICVYADTDIFSKAPQRLTAAGISDLMAKYICLADWKIANLVTGEYFCRETVKLEEKALKTVKSSIQDITEGEEDECEQLMYALILSGLAMQMIGNSRPASCAEHQVTHLWDMEVINGPLDALHGEKVSVAALLVLEEYKRIAAAITQGRCHAKPYENEDEELLKETFGKKGLLEEIRKENEPELLETISPQHLEKCLNGIEEIIDELPSEQTMFRLLEKAGCAKTVYDIGLDESAGLYKETVKLIENQQDAGYKRRMIMRVGMGYDVHRLTEDRDLILGGVKIDWEKGLLGHSDADVLIHAVMDALLGAAALGDIGKHFPDTDPAYKGISSILLLEHVTKLLREHHYEIGNIDATIIAQKPKMAPHIPQMRANMAKAMGINESQLNIKATTEEKLGFTGREEGIASQAICLLNERKES